MARGLVGSEILRISGEIRARIAAGTRVYNLTVGDFRSDQFPIPEPLRDATIEALRRGETNYPPSDGMPDLRKAVAELYRSELDLPYDAANVVVSGGARPAIYATYRTLLDPGDVLLYPVPSWNNNHYAWIMGAKGTPVVARPETNFLPTAEDLRPHIASARVLILNSPLNPAGTAFGEKELEAIVRLIRDENAARDRRGAAPLVLLYDHVYWTQTYGSVRHLTPLGIDSKMREVTIFTDAASKSFAATGLRVGWCVGPEEYMTPLSALLGHIGAWAPRPEQVAVARWLRDGAARAQFRTKMNAGIAARLNALHEGFTALRETGYPVETIPPQAAIYLSARFNVIGRKTGDGRRLDTNEAIRSFLLEEASLAIVPFQAFGLAEETGWFRLSVGALALEDLDGLFPALRRALDSLTR